MIFCHKFASVKKCCVILVLTLIILDFYSHRVESKSTNNISNSSNVKEVERHEQFVKKLEKTRTLKVNHKIMMPMLIWVLIKVVAVIPVVLIVAIVIGGISVIGSKLSLIISLILGIRALHSLISAGPKDATTMSYDDYIDLQRVMAKQTMNKNAVKHKAYIPMEALKQGMLTSSDLMQANLNHQQMQDMYMNNLKSLMNNSAYSTLDAINMNQKAIDQAGQVAGSHAADVMDQNDEGLNKYHAKIFAQKRAKVYALADMAKRVNSLMRNQKIENHNVRVGVKI